MGGEKYKTQQSTQQVWGKGKEGGGGQQQKYTKYLFRRNQFYGNSVFIATKKQPPKGAARRWRRRRWRSQICALNYAELHNVCECVYVSWCGSLCVSVYILKCFLWVAACVCICVRECLNVHKNVVSQEKNWNNNKWSAAMAAGCSHGKRVRDILCVRVCAWVELLN